MARPLIVRAFTDELPIKLLSLVLAITLFVLVRNDKDATSGAYVKVIYTLPEDRVLVSDPVPEVKVSVRGPWTKLQHLDRSIDPIRIDLTRVHTPDVRIDDDLVKLPAGVRVASITPSEVHVEFEQRIVREVPVQPILEGQPAEGYRVLKVVAEPSKVRVDGAKSAVDAIERVPTRPLRIADARGPVKGDVALEPPPVHTRFLEATTVMVRADIQPAMVEKVLDDMPIKVVGLTRMDGTVDPPTAKLTLRGPSVLLGDVSDKTISLKVEGSLIDGRPPAKYIRSLVVSGLPAGVAAEVQPDTIMLTTKRKRE
ncbi:MAG: YbbR family protein [Myxococcales bacterium]|nr:YbbR family protein [Myxococcales bacterium]